MGTPAILGLVALTSLIAYGWGAWRRGLPAGGLPGAARRMAEGVGTSLIFLGLNLGVGTVVVLAVRLGGGFASFYPLGDATIPLLSLLQGLTFQWWREGR